jgi:pimeloyl-ACP methyl ester carboxylesterase
MPHPARKTVTSKDGATIYYERTDAQSGKPTLVFVHGIGGDVDGWQFVREPLCASGFGTISIDLRGHGYSSHPWRASAYKLNRIEDDILAVLAAEHVEKPVLIGHSGGAVVAAQFAASHKDVLSRLVLINGSYCPPAWLQNPVLRAVANAVITVGGVISPPPYTRPGHHGGWHSPYPPGKHHKEVEVYGLLRTMFYNSLRSYLYTSYELINVDLSNELQNISVPTLLISSEKDGIFPPVIQQEMQRKIPNSKLIVLANTNHVSVLNNPGGVADAIVEFLL